MNIMHPEAAPVILGQVPIVTGEVVPDFFDQSGWAEQVDGFPGCVQMADQQIDPHQVVHVAMTDENRIDMRQGPFCQMMQLTTVEQQVGAGRTDFDQQQRVVQQARQKIWLEVAKRKADIHLWPLC